MKTNSSKRKTKRNMEWHRSELTLGNDKQIVASYFPTIPRTRRQSSFHNRVFDNIPQLIEIVPRGEVLTRSRFRQMLKQTLAMEYQKWHGGVHFKSNEGKKIQLRKKAVRLILHGFEDMTVCNDETRFLAVEYLDQLLDKTEMELDEISFRAAAAVSFRLACKIEEVIMAPDVMFEFTSDTLCKWEMSLLQCLNWQTTIPTISTFLSFFFNSTNLCISPILGRKVKQDAMKLAECCVLDSRTGVFRASIKAACCFMLALRNNGIEDWQSTVDLIELGKENSSLDLSTCISLVSLYWTSSSFKGLFLTQSELSHAFTYKLSMDRY